MATSITASRRLSLLRPSELLRIQPGQWRIGTRLTLCFGSIVLLMVSSHAFTLWQFGRVRQQQERMLELDEESRAVLSFHANLLMLRDRLEELVAAENSSRFATEAIALRREFLEQAWKADRAIRTPVPPAERDPTVLSTLETVESSLPGQIDALIDLANARDWPAVRLRVQNQVTPFTALTSQLVESVDREVSNERADAQERVQRLQGRVFAMHILAALLTLLVAGILGTIVTRSITQPLAQLDAGAHALALGDFQHRINVTGNDELAMLARVFNDATQRLSALYGALKDSEERFRTVVTAAPVGIALLDENSMIRMVNHRFLEITGLTAAQAAGMKLTDPNIAVQREDGTPCPTGERPSQKALSTGKPVLNEVLTHRNVESGEPQWILTSAWPLLRADGSVSQVISTLTDITEQKRAERTLLEMSSRMLRIQEEEQRRIAREVHDSTSQEMTALTLNLGALQAVSSALPEKARAHIAESLAIAKQVAREIRTFSYLLHPPLLNELGLWAALQMFIQEFRERSRLQVELNIDKEVEAAKLDLNREITLYRFVQEALANVHRHSGSTTASVSVRSNEQAIEAVVTDAGRGIPPKLLNEIRESKGVAGGVGLAGMHERISYVGGKLTVQSDEHGTTLIAIVPVPKDVPKEDRPAQTQGFIT